jgi:predicted CoA-binding protein
MEAHCDKLNRKLDKLLERQKQPLHPSHKQQQNFYPCTVNLTNITFTKEEQALLDLGLQHNIQKPLKKYWTNLILETEKALRLLETKEQNAFRIMAAKKLKQIYNTHNTHKRQCYILKNINYKLAKENAMIILADKRKATVIIYRHDYAKKVHTFLTDNNFHTLPDNPTNKDQIRIQKTAQQCDQIIHKLQIKYVTQKKPHPSTLTAQLKLHKPRVPIQLVVNNRTVPSYKMAKRLNDIINKHLLLDNHYTTHNSTSLANDLVKLTISDKHRLITLDIKDLYINIPLKETIDITRTRLLKHNNTQTTNQIITLLEVILRQNYFTFQEQIYQPNKGVAMGSPVSGTMAKICIQYLEDSHIKHLLDSKGITFYSRYVDDIFIICDSSYTIPNAILQYANTIRNNLQLNPTPENAGQINFLDLTITRKTTCLEIDIFRKPTTTSTTINYISNHPLEHKLAAYRYYIERMFTLPLNKEHQRKEWTTMLESHKVTISQKKPPNQVKTTNTRKSNPYNTTHRIQKQH